jgi:pSer/pThr/pTyr-binding forkhead associated (FHA) protein
MGRGPVLQVGSIAYPLHRVVTTVGRRGHEPEGDHAAPAIDLTRMDRRRVASRRHAELHCDGRAVYLRDVGSTNGTLVNNELLLRATVIRLVDGDRISFGGVEAHFEAAGEWPTHLSPQWRGAADGDAALRATADDTLPGPRAR